MIEVLVLCRFQVVLGELREGAIVGSEAGEPNGKKEAIEKTGIKMLTDEPRK